MKSKIKRALSRAKYAAVGAAIGAAIGGLANRNAASTGGALGGLAGATIADFRSGADGVFAELRPGKEADAEADDDSAAVIELADQ
jgi:outer membrane lipoprotein SlyB